MVNIDPDSSAISPKRPFSAISKNPRRTLPSQSKSLPRSKRVKLDHITSHGTQDQSSHALPRESTDLPLEKSQESSSDQSATKWFDRVNENVKQTAKHTSKHEDESPFFLARQTTYNHPNGLRSTNGESFGGPRQQTDTENDDLRGVIDDLTVENKKLKQLLKTSQSRGKPSKPNPDKVLEIRTHGLPSDKKRELEQLLKTFTLGLHASTPSQPSSSSAFNTNPQSASKSGSKRQMDRSVGDSGYASIATSGLNSTSQSGGNRTQEAVSQSNREKNIKDYLHDIPNSLLPQESTTIDEHSKMALVVQRLEQLFTGKSAVPGEHSLPIQQQKISRSAARADRRDDVKNNRETKEEGIREAHMLPQDTKINLDAFEQDQQGSKAKNFLGSGSTSDAPGSSLGETNSPDQRPTRPLDLDIHRAQVVEDNIQYLRHLGLSLPEFDHEPQMKGQPWMYLNLLTGMAQLHTLNVTPAFIRKAIKKFSTRFELSKDEHKIRWKGAAEPMFLANPSESPSFATRRFPEDGDDAGRRSRRSATSTLNEQASVSVSEDRTGQSGNSKNVHSTSTSTNLQTGLSRDQSKSSVFDYKPIVYQGKRLQLKPSYHDYSSSHGSISPESSGLVHAPTRSSLKAKDDYQEGLVTFFSNPYYCADLSGDSAPVNLQPGLYSWSTQVLGVPELQDNSHDTLRDAQACYFTSINGATEPDWDTNCPDLLMTTHPIFHAGEFETRPLELPASGIGGVRPEENFALDVKVERSTRRNPGVAKTTMTKLSKNNRQQMKFGYTTVGCEKLTLQPSQLPPPSYVFFTSSSDSSAGRGYADNDDSSSSSSHADESPAPADFMWQWASSSQDNEVDEAAESAASSSLGVLEGARARLNSSKMVTGDQDEYVVNQAGRAVSGSLAATVGASWSAASIADHDENREVEMAASEMEID